MGKCARRPCFQRLWDGFGQILTPLVMLPSHSPSGKSCWVVLCPVLSLVCCRCADPHTHQSLSVSQLYPNLVIRDMVERWLEGGEVPAGASSSAPPAAEAAADSATTSKEERSQLQGHVLQRQDSEDPLSSFGVSSGFSSIDSQGYG